MFIVLSLILLGTFSQTIKQLNEISLDEELPIGSFVSSLIDKIDDLEQSIEFDLVTPSSSEFDLFAIDHQRRILTVKKRIDYEKICRNSSNEKCVLSVSIAVANQQTINVYILPIELKNLDDNPLKYLVNRTVIEIEENDGEWKNRSYPLARALDDDGESIEYDLLLHNWSRPIGLFEFDAVAHRLKPLRTFDHEQENLYRLRLVARQTNGANIFNEILVFIKDQNDHRPECRSPIEKFHLDHRNSTSFYTLNVTDLDQGENGKLTFQFFQPFPPAGAFRLDRFTGEIRFDRNFLSIINQTSLTINVTDHGAPRSLSTLCSIPLEISSDFNVDFQFFSNVENLRSPLGRIRFDENSPIDFRSSIDELFIFNSTTKQIFFDLNSPILFRIFTQNSQRIEQIDVTFFLENFQRQKKTFSTFFRFDKEKIRRNSRIFYAPFHEILSINELVDYCPSKKSFSVLNDPTSTFEFDENRNSIQPRKTAEEKFYLISIENNERCSVEIRIFLLDRFSKVNVVPHLNETFLIINSENRSQWKLPTVPEHVRYVSTFSNENLLVDNENRSFSLRTLPIDFVDFHLDLIDSRTPSFSTSILVRLIHAENRHPPRFFNRTERKIFAFDPDFAVEDNFSFPPTVEFSIESNDNVRIHPYQGQLTFNETRPFNITVLLTDFGQPKRFTTRINISINVQPTAINVSNPFFLVAFILSIVFILCLLVVLLVSCSTSSSNKNENKPSTHPDSHLIDHEYITTSTSLPRLINREQRVYPTLTPNSSLDRIYAPTSNNGPHHLSLNEINKYLERFEKIYNNSNEQTMKDSIGSVV